MRDRARRSTSPPSRARVLERYPHLRRAGAALDGEAKKRLAEIIERLATLGTASARTCSPTSRPMRWPSTSEAELAGLPDFMRAAARRRRRNAASTAAVVTLSRSSVEPFLQISRAARPARKGVPRLDRARRQRRRDRQQGDHRRDGARCAPSARGCWAIPTSRIIGSTTPWRKRRAPSAACSTRVDAGARPRARRP